MTSLPAELRAERVALRRWRLSHLDDLMRAIWRSHRELRQWMPWAIEMPTAEAEREFLAHAIASFDAGEEFVYGIFDNSNDELVGGIGLRHSSSVDAMEIGYWVRSHRTGEGIATSAAATLTVAAFAYLPELDVVTIQHDVSNRASGAIPPKVGYRRDREIGRPILSPGQTGRALMWVITRDDLLPEHDRPH